MFTCLVQYGGGVRRPFYAMATSLNTGGRGREFRLLNGHMCLLQYEGGVGSTVWVEGLAG